MRGSQQWLFGDAAQQERARNAAKSGETVFPLYDAEGNVRETRAPMVMSATGLVIAPDLLVSNPYSGVRLEDVKAKRQPGWNRNAARWEHGIDFASFSEYARLQRESKLHVVIVVKEERSPKDSYENGPLHEPGSWLFAGIATLAKCGHHVAAWPRANDRGKNGEGGWLWPRDCMARLDPSDDAEAVATLMDRAVCTLDELETAFARATAHRSAHRATE